MSEYFPTCSSLLYDERTAHLRHYACFPQSWKYHLVQSFPCDPDLTYSWCSMSRQLSDSSWRTDRARLVSATRSSAIRSAGLGSSCDGYVAKLDCSWREASLVLLGCWPIAQVLGFREWPLFGFFYHSLQIAAIVHLSGQTCVCSHLSQWFLAGQADVRVDLEEHSQKPQALILHDSVSLTEKSIQDLWCSFAIVAQYVALEMLEIGLVHLYPCCNAQHALALADHSSSQSAHRAPSPMSPSSSRRRQTSQEFLFQL